MRSSSLTLLRELCGGTAARRHVGVMVPWANSVVEAELPSLADGRVVWHYARLVPPGRGTALDPDFLRGLGEAVPGAVEQLSRLRLDGLLLACTSAGFSGAVPFRDLGIDIRDAFSCLVDSLRLLAAHRVVLLTPYPVDVTRTEVEALERVGVDVVDHACLDRDDDYASVEPSVTRALFDDLPTASVAACEAVVLSCTGWPTASLLGEIEGRTERPVLSSNLALVLSTLASGV